MTDEILKLNENNELIAEDPSTGDTRPIKVADLSASGDVSATNVTADTQMNSSSTRPNIFADTVDANQLTGVSTGGVYQEDSNSPFQSNGSDIDAQLSQNYKHVIGLILTDGTRIINNGDMHLTINGGGGPAHDYRRHDGTVVSNTSIRLGDKRYMGGRFQLTENHRDRVVFSSQIGHYEGQDNFAEYGRIDDRPISSIQLFDKTNGRSADIGTTFRVFVLS